MKFHKHNAGRFALAAALLLGTSALVHAQQTPATPATPMAGADARLVAEADATHAAHLTGANGTGTAWFMADAQNNTLRWTIELDGVNVGGANIACPPGEGAGAGPGAAPADTTLAVAMMAPIEAIMTETPATPAGATPATPAATPATPAGATPATPAGATPAAPAGATPAMPAGAMPAADATAAVEVLDLFEGATAGETMNGPIEGEAANLDGPVFAQIEAGACFLNIQTAAATTTPATPAAGATPAAPAGAGATPPATPAPAGGATPPVTPAPAG